VVYANELIEPAALRYVAAELQRDPKFELYCLADSVEGVEAMQRELAAAGAPRPIEVLVEVGHEGGRCGCRTVDQAVAVAEAIHAAPLLHLAGVEAFEGLRSAADLDAALAGVDAFMAKLLDVFERIRPLVRPGGFFSIFMHGQGNRALYATNRWLRAWTAKASYRTTWNFCLVLTAMGKVLEKIPFVGPVLYLVGRQVLFFSPDQHNNFDHFSAGFTSFHRKEEIRGWYAGWDDVAVRYQGVASESIYARGARPLAAADDGADVHSVNGVSFT